MRSSAAAGVGCVRSSRRVTCRVLGVNTRPFMVGNAKRFRAIDAIGRCEALVQSNQDLLLSRLSTPISTWRIQGAFILFGHHPEEPSIQSIQTIAGIHAATGTPLFSSNGEEFPSHKLWLHDAFCKQGTGRARSPLRLNGFPAVTA